MDTEWKNQITVQRKCELHIIFYINKRISITPHFKIIKIFKTVKEAKLSTKRSCNSCCKTSNDNQDANLYTLFEIQYSVQDLLIDIHEEKKLKSAMFTTVKVHAVV